MPTQATVIAPSNIAFIKYWGTRDAETVEPFNPSISMTLDRCVSTCTATFHPGGGGRDRVWFRREGGGFEPASEGFVAPVRRHLNRLRDRAGRAGSFEVLTENSFPTGAGIASSASGFAALTLAALEALGTPPEDLNEASRWARLSGSGSAARSVAGGYVRWPAAAGGDGIEVLAGADHWALCDLVAIVDESAKDVPSREGHRRAPTSPRFEPRLAELPDRLRAVEEAIRERDIQKLGAVVEDEAVDLHRVAMSSTPPTYYWKGGTLEVLWRIRELRAEGVPVYATIDAGPNVHALCPADVEVRVSAALAELDGVVRVLADRVGTGPRASERHLERDGEPGREGRQ